jgi:hypothetical protein
MVFGLAAVVPHWALAASPLKPMEFGAAQGVLDFCSKVDPKDDRSFDAQAKLLLAGLSRDKIEDERESAAYHQAYQTIGTILNGFTAPDAVQACQAIVN